MSLANWGALEKVLVKEGYQVFVPKGRFVREEGGGLDEGMVRGAWVDMFGDREERARAVDGSAGGLGR